MTNRIVPLRQLFLRSLFLSASTIGGGYVMISVMRRMYVEKYRLLSEEDMLDIASLAQSMPGAAAVNASILLGYRLHGICGAAVSVIGTVLPPLCILSVLTFFYKQISVSPIFAKFLMGMQVGVAAVILDAAIGMIRQTVRIRDPFGLLLFVFSAAAAMFTDVNPALLAAAAFLIGAVRTLLVGKRKGGRA